MSLADASPSQSRCVPSSWRARVRLAPRPLLRARQMPLMSPWSRSLTTPATTETMSWVGL